ncbi:hemerythrin domain-containing protein [Paenibacillus sp. HB172176]|uniref:hemerythrin domain-containing protein n=1 Tax=Paenibacillus sp. HB172176 TaxID=2493690 RepID=UPI00143A9807|nr:hemerythrin domain-containing protein [Paenibacillus sp. HB172176]
MNNIGKFEPMNAARPSAFMLQAIRLKEEHELLKLKVDALCELSMQASSSANSKNVIAVLNQLQRGAAELMLNLKTHTQWENEELFPILSQYFKRKIEPTMMPSMWMLEKDFELALQFFSAFMEDCKAIRHALLLDLENDGVIAAEQMKSTANELTQGCLILTGHFQLEEEVIYPLTDEILTDIDYLFS